MCYPVIIIIFIFIFFAFQSIDFKRIWWMALQKHIVPKSQELQVMCRVSMVLDYVKFVYLVDIKCFVKEL